MKYPTLALNIFTQHFSFLSNTISIRIRADGYTAPILRCHFERIILPAIRTSFYPSRIWPRKKISKYLHTNVHSILPVSHTPWVFQMYTRGFAVVVCMKKKKKRMGTGRDVGARLLIHFPHSSFPRHIQKRPEPHPALNLVQFYYLYICTLSDFFFISYLIVL